MAEMFRRLSRRGYCIEEEPLSYECSEFDFDPDSDFDSDEEKSQRSSPRTADRRC
jgi:hypothetical protein